MTEITILTGFDTFVLGDDAAADLLAHIRSAGGQNREAAEAPVLAAIDSRDAHDVSWSDEGKHGAPARHQRLADLGRNRGRCPP